MGSGTEVFETRQAKQIRIVIEGVLVVMLTTALLMIRDNGVNIARLQENQISQETRMGLIERLGKVETRVDHLEGFHDSSKK